MAAEAKPRRQAKLDAEAIRAASRADAARIRDEALADAKRIREEAVEEIVKLMSTLTTERDHILADARDDARRIVEAAREEADAITAAREPSPSSAETDPPPHEPAPRDTMASPAELDELFFSGTPEPTALAQPRPVARRRRKRFRLHH